MTKNFRCPDFNYIFYFVLGFMIGFLFGFNTINVYGANWNENNNFEDINSITQYTTLNDILSDTSYSMDKNGILDFVHSDYDYKYIVSYCNSGDCGSSSTNRSIDLIGFNKPIKMKVEQNKQNLKINFIGSEGDTVAIFDHSQIWGGWYDMHLTGNYAVDNREYAYARSVFDITYYSNFNSPLPNFYYSDTLFKGTDFLDNYYKNLGAFKDVIILGVVFLIVILLLCKKFHIFIYPKSYGSYKGGGKF